jgi:hypothetical protein
MKRRNSQHVASTDQLAAWRKALAASKRHQRARRWQQKQNASGFRYRPGMARKQPPEAS